MKYKIIFALVVMVSVSGATFAQANEDINPQTRDMSVIMAQFAAIQVQLDKVAQLMGASVATAQADFIITIDEAVVVQKPVAYMSEASARAQCEAVAYNTDHMWKLVTCTFGTDTLYRDVFIAG